MDFRKMFVDLYVDKYGATIDKKTATEIVHSLAVTDGSQRENGEKYTYEQSLVIGDEMKVDWNQVPPSEWYLVLNRVYSGFYRTAERLKLPDAVFPSLAFDWFYDVDGDREKTFRVFIHL